MIHAHKANRTNKTKQTIVLSIWSSFVPVLLWYTSLRLVYRAKSWPWKNPIKLHVPRETSIQFKTFFKKIKNDRGYPTGCKVADASIEHTYSTSYKVCLLGTTLRSILHLFHRAWYNHIWRPPISNLKKKTTTFGGRKKNIARSM